MSIDTNTVRTADGDTFRVLAEDLPGDLPVLIFIDRTGETARLDRNGQCPANPGHSLSQPRSEHTRYFNVYRAADGGFVMGSRAFKSNGERLQTHDSQRAIVGLRIVLSNDGTFVDAGQV